MIDAQHPFADVPDNARGHLGLFFYETALRVIGHLRRQALAARKSLETVFEDFPFLRTYFEELRTRLPSELAWEQYAEWFRTNRETWEAQVPGWLPLRGLRDELHLPDEVQLALILAGLPEEESRFASLFAALLHPQPQRGPSLGLIRQILADSRNTESDAWSFSKPLLENGLVEALNRDGPRSEWILRVPFLIWSALRGEPIAPPGMLHHPPESLTSLDELILPESERARLAELTSLLSTRRTRAVVVRGLPGTERLAVVGAMARALNRGILEIEQPVSPQDERVRAIGPFCTLGRALPVFQLDLGPGESYEIPHLQGYHGPIAAILGVEGGLNGPLTEHSITVHLQPEPPELRLQILQRALQCGPTPELQEIARTFALPGRYLRRAAKLAQCGAALERRASITCEDVRQATRTINRQQLDSLATHLSEGGRWSQLVVRVPTDRALRHLERRCRHREQLSQTMGSDLPGGLNRGVRALFEGPSGTGKTLAARILAAELGLDLYRVDVAAIVNKYIGETEKNLSRVLTRAEDLDVILLLDEGDSLMTRRTDVKSAHDRYANLETNYLLQRLESYSGIVIVTTNVGNSIDAAFRRRIDMIVKFHLPDADERWRLWQVHLPATHAIAPADFEHIAVRYETTGGQIRNAAIQAALFALDDSRECISTSDLRAAIELEYRKAGAAVPAGEMHTEGRHEARISGFLSAIS